jgi:flagellar hook-associated protein 2
MALSSPGIGSNLDINGIVSQLMTIEQRPLQLIEVKEASYQAQLSAFGSLKGSLSSLQNASTSMSKETQFQSLKATSSDTSVLSASAVSSAAAGTYSIEVSKLAQAQKLAAVGQSSMDTVFGSGTLTFDFGTTSGSTFTSNGSASRTITIDNTNNTLGGIRDAINAAEIGVKASIVNDGGASPYRLVLSAESTGLDQSMKISVAGDAALSTLLEHDPAGTQNLTETIAAQNAEMKVNGIPVTKTKNTVTDAINGVTLNLLNVTTTPINVTVAKDSSAVKTALESFVKAFNESARMLRDVSAYDASTKQSAILQGDSAVRTIQTQMRGLLNTPQSGATGSYSSLSQIGVSFQKDGTLLIDAAKLQNAIDSDMAGVSSVVAETGKSSKAWLDNIVGASGTIASRSDGLNRSIKTLDNQREVLNRRLIGIEQRYRTQFTALDTLIASMTQTSNFLTQQLANLPGASN